MKVFSSIAAPLTELIKKDVPFVWGEEQEKSFQALKLMLSFTPLPNYLTLIRTLKLNVMLQVLVSMVI